MERLPEVDFEKWYSDALDTQGGMVGSAYLDWPNDIYERTAMQ